MKVAILQDIERPNGEIYYARTARIEYDAKAPKSRKLHHLIFQQGILFGQVGDKCEYLTHDELLAYQAAGVVSVIRG